jgi:hypothetical protein
MVESLEDLHLSNGGDGESILLLLGVDALQCHNLASVPIGAHKDAPGIGFLGVWVLKKA